MDVNFDEFFGHKNATKIKQILSKHPSFLNYFNLAIAKVSDEFDVKELNKHILYESFVYAFYTTLDDLNMIGEKFIGDVFVNRVISYLYDMLNVHKLYLV